MTNTTNESISKVKKKLNDVRDSKVQVKRRLEELRLSLKPAWKDAKQGVERAWHSLSGAADGAAETVERTSSSRNDLGQVATKPETTSLTEKRFIENIDTLRKRAPQQLEQGSGRKYL